jgi:putative ABC transport system ATP-binding protein
MPSFGKILMDGLDLTTLPAHRRAGRVALVSQSRGAGIPGHMQVREVLWAFSSQSRSPFSLMRRSRAEREARAMLEPLLPQLCERLDSQVKTLSAGEYQILSLACSTRVLADGVHHATRVLLLDEHVAHLDSRTATFVMDLTCRAIREQGLSGILVSHDLPLATSVSDRVVVLRDGGLVYDGRPIESEHASVLIYGAPFEPPMPRPTLASTLGDTPPLGRAIESDGP